MNDIIQRLVDKSGLSEEQAASAVQTVVGFIKEKLPAPIAAQVESIVGGAGGGEAMSSIGSAVGGMFGKG